MYLTSCIDSSTKVVVLIPRPQSLTHFAKIRDRNTDSNIDIKAVEMSIRILENTISNYEYFPQISPLLLHSNNKHFYITISLTTYVITLKKFWKELARLLGAATYVYS